MLRKSSPSRPLPAALAPLLKGQLERLLEALCMAFPPARACLEAAADGSGSVQLQKMAAFRGRPAGLAAIRDEHDADVIAELSEGKHMCPAASPHKVGRVLRRPPPPLDVVQFTAEPPSAQGCSICWDVQYVRSV